MSSALYEPIVSDTEIRLLKLFPGDGILRAELLHVDLQHNPGYEAISYTWGDPVDEEDISINNVTIKIRPNLSAFLRRLRVSCPSTGRLLWVDGICINQTDLHEKSSQVARMDKTFNRAKRVLSWVGEHADGSETLFKPPSRTSILQLKPSRRAQLNRWATWLPFLDRPYWTRTWIVQELILAQSILLYCGSNHMDFDDAIAAKMVSRSKFSGILLDRETIPKRFDGIDVEIVLRVQAHPGWNEDENVEVLLRLYRIVSMRQQYRSSAIRSTLTQFGNMSANYGSLLELIASFGGTQCLDPRDKVFALMSLEVERQGSWKQQIFHKIRPDYGKDSMKLFVEVCYLRIMAYDGFARDPSLNLLPYVFDALGLDKQVDGLRMIDYLLNDSGLFTSGGEYEIYVLSSLARMLVFRLGESSDYFQGQKTILDLMTTLRQFRTDYGKPRPKATAAYTSYPAYNYNPYAAASYPADLLPQSDSEEAAPANPSYAAYYSTTYVTAPSQPGPNPQTYYTDKELEFSRYDVDNEALKARAARRAAKRRLDIRQ